MKKSLIPLVFCASVISIAHAQKANIQVNADRDTVALQEYFTLTVTFQNCDANTFKMPEAIDDDFTLAGRPMSQTSMSIVNGAVSSSASYTYQLAPKKAGKVDIEGIEVKTADGKIIKAEKVKIVVLKEGKTSSKNKKQKANTPQNQPQISPFPSPFPSPFERPNDQNDPYSRKPKRKTIQI
jgi:hypothetical protein